jgi:hypothetical protein
MLYTTFITIVEPISLLARDKQLHLQPVQQQGHQSAKHDRSQALPGICFARTGVKFYRRNSLKALCLT